MLRDEDRHAFHSDSGYNCTNECLLTHREMIKDLSIERSAGIASGGEVLFGVLLPFTRGEVIGVDHSYKAILLTHLKAILLNTHGAQGVIDTFSKPFRKAIDNLLKLSDQLPDSLRPIAQKDLTTRSAVYENSYTPALSIGDMRYIVSSWKSLPEEIWKKGADRLQDLTLLHGDLTDIPGEVDLLYTSNALTGFNDRNGKVLEVPAIKSLVKVGSHMLATSIGRCMKEDWIKVSEKKATSPHRMTWTHQLLRKAS